MRILENKTPEQIISEQKSFTDQIHIALLITEHGDHPNGLGSSIKLFKNQELKKIIEEIYGALLDGGLETNGALSEKINEIISSNQNVKDIEILGHNLFYAFQNLKDEQLKIKRFSEAKKQSSEIKDLINDFLKIFYSPGGKSARDSFIGFKKIQKSNQKRKVNHNGSLKNSTPWLIKSASKAEFENHSFISKIWNTNNEISKIRETKDKILKMPIKNKDKTLLAIKFFENSINLYGFMRNFPKLYSENLKFSEESLDNLIFGLIFHNDLHNGNIITQFNQNNSVDLKLIDFEEIKSNLYPTNIFTKDLFIEILLRPFLNANIENIFLLNEFIIQVFNSEKDKKLNLKNLSEPEFLWNFIKNKKINFENFKKENNNNSEELTYIKKKYLDSNQEIDLEKIFSKEIVFNTIDNVYKDQNNENNQISKLENAIINLGLAKNFLFLIVNGYQLGGEFAFLDNQNNFKKIFKIKYALDLADQNISITKDKFEDNQEYKNYLEKEKKDFNKKTDEEKVKYLEKIIERQIEFSKKYFLKYLFYYLFAQNFQENFVSPKKILQSLKKIKERIFKNSKELGIETKEEKAKLSQIQEHFREFTRNLYKKQVQNDEKDEMHHLNENQLKELKNLIPTKFSSKIIKHLSLTMLASVSAFGCCFALKKFDDNIAKTKLLITGAVSLIVSFVLLEVFSKLIDLEPKIDEFTDFVSQIDIDKLI